MRTVAAFVGLAFGALALVVGAEGAARSEETLRLSGKAARPRPTIAIRSESAIDGAMAILGKAQPLHATRSLESEERELDGGKVEIRFLKLVDEGVDLTAGVLGRKFVVDEVGGGKAASTDRKIASALNTRARAHRHQRRVWNWLAARTFVRGVPVTVPLDEIRALLASPEYEVTEGSMSFTWVEKKGAVATFRVVAEVDTKGPGVTCRIKLAGTMAADDESAEIVDVDLGGALKLSSLISMTGTVKVHDRRR